MTEQLNKAIVRRHGYPGRCIAAARLFLLAAGLLLAGSAGAMLENVTSEQCLRGDCMNDRGTLELSTPWGKGRYTGEFRDGEFHGYGRLEIPISFLAKEVYVGYWDMGVRSGRGTHWNGDGKLYIGEWENNKRHGRGTYVINLPRWEENKHTEFWLKENTENYTGEFVNGHYQGQGTYRWADGQKYVGGFFASEKHGHGTFYYATGTARQQYWEYGDLIR